MSPRLAVLGFCTLLFMHELGLAEVRAATPSAAGEAIYRQGILPSGQPLRAKRNVDGVMSGAGAACVNCHRRSGLGSAEGRFRIPPITGRYLFRPDGAALEDMDVRYGPQYLPNVQAYTEAGLARAIRQGIGKDGKPLDELMPRFDLDDAAMAELIRYLRDLSSGPVPGVTEEALHFATIITPDADPLKRQGMLGVLQRFFTDKNEFIRGGIHPMHSSRLAMYRVARRWQLHVWQLTGPPDSWERQLREWQAAEPVFAVVSGLGGADWTPVHRFCEQARLPCILPNVDLPVVADDDFYPIYFSRGVLLEAQLISGAILRSRARRVVQLYREGDVGTAAAQSLAALLRKAGRKVEERVLKRESDAASVARLVADVAQDEQLVLWLRPSDLAALPPRAPDAGTQAVYLSGLMGGLESAPLPAGWRAAAHMTYPYDLPEQRRVRMNFPLAWLNVRHIQLVDERIQSDTWLACRILAESLGDVVESFLPDYLLEQMENMLSKRQVNGYYPRLSLAPGQRFASKGGYMVRFDDSRKDAIRPEGEWTVP